MDFGAALNLYCERVERGFWAEPLNALSNVGFLLAAAAAFALWRRRGGRDGPALALIFVTAAVGVGSFVFHTLATRGAALFDVVPIAIFILLYFFLSLRRFFGLGLFASAAATALFAIFSYAFGAAVHGLNGSVAYLPALFALIAFAMLLWPKPPARALFVAATLFAIALLLRTIDRDVCAAFPLGTHFLWHLFNALVLWVLLRAAMLSA